MLEESLCGIYLDGISSQVGVTKHIALKRYNLSHGAAFPVGFIIVTNSNGCWLSQLVLSELGDLQNPDKHDLAILF